jgi:hypothetical protein
MVSEHTVNTAKEIVPMMNHSELLCLSSHGGSAPCCVNDASHAHFGRCISFRSPRLNKDIVYRETERDKPISHRISLTSVARCELLHP